MATLEYRAVIKALTAHDPQFSVKVRKGKGSHRMLHHPDVDGDQRHFPLPYHGQKTPIYPGYQREMIRIFQLPNDIFD